MRRYFVVKDDPLEFGGFVTSGIPTVDVECLDGKMRCLARRGDHVVCKLHGPTVITGGTITIIVHGHEQALDGDWCGCGCTVMAKLQRLMFADFDESASAAYEAPAQDAPFLLSGKSPVCLECLLSGAQSAAPLLGR